MHFFIMKKENPDTYDFIIVGGGVHGLSTAYHLLEDGKRKSLSYKILLLEQYRIGNQWGSSHGPSRWYKNYYSNPLFKTLTQRCFEKYWPEM
jgi:sarcosine oxidase